MAEPTPITLKHRLKHRIRDMGSPLNNRWQAYLTEEQTLEHALEGAFWTDAAEVVKGFDGKGGRQDIIELRKPDTSEYWELMIDEVGKGYLRVRVMYRDNPPAAIVPDDSPLTMKWVVGNRTYDVIRKLDNEVMSRGFQTKRLAAEWITKHMKAMAA